MKKILISILILFVFVVGAEAATFTSRDIKQPAETKLFISSNSPLIKDYATAKAITTAGSPDIVTTTVRNGKYSINFNAASDSISTLYSVDFDFGTGNHTLDFWIYCNSDANDFIIFSNKNENTTWYYYLACIANKLQYQCYIAPAFRCRYSCDFNLSANTWYHVAVVRNGSTCLMFINGVSQAVTETTAFTGGIGCTTPNPLYIGYDIFEASRYINGFLSDVRITKGKALWTSNFTPPRRSGAF